MRILGISRALKYSPRMEGRDAAIFMAVTDRLRGWGHEVRAIREDEMRGHDFSVYDKVFTMARDVETLMAVQTDLGPREARAFVNSLDGSLACAAKTAVCVHMDEAGLPQPDWTGGEGGVSTCGSQLGWKDLALPLWVKNGDGSSTRADDTTYCKTAAEVENALAELAKRGVRTWMAQEHKRGDLVKFYGVEGTDFFLWTYVSPDRFKFGHERMNGESKGYKFSADRLRLYADMLSRKLGVPVYGGDAVVDSEGEFWFVDFNDFPSFSTCVDNAAEAIARRITQP